MSWNRLIEDASASRQNRFVGSEDSLQFSDNKLAKRNFQDSLNYFPVGFATPVKKPLQKHELPIDSRQLQQILQLITQANSKIQQLERRLADKPTVTSTAVQTQPTEQLLCLRKIVQRLNRQ